MAAGSLDIAPSNKVMLWIHAKSRSTAFEFAMASDPSIKVFHEHFVMAYFYGEDRNCSELFRRGSPVPGYKYQEVKDRLEKASPCSEKTTIFAKDWPAFARGRDYKYLPNGYTHTFIIRNPKASILSTYKCNVSEGFLFGVDKHTGIGLTIEVGGFEPLYNLYKYVTEELKQPAIIVESDDLVSYPRETLQKYCQSTGIPFSENFLHWKPGNVDHFPDKLKDPGFLNEFYKTAIESTCFLPPSQSPVDVSELPDELKLYIDSVMPLYEEMATNKL